MKLTNEQLMAAAKADFAKVYRSSGHALFDIALENIFLRGFAAGGQFASEQIFRNACNDMTDKAVNKIIGEQK